MPSSATDPILGLLQEQLECCRNLEGTTEKVLELLQTGQTDAALSLLDGRQVVTLQMQNLESRINELHSRDGVTGTVRTQRRYRAVAEGIGESVRKQLELEDRIADALGRLAEDSGKAIGELEEGSRLVSSYAEGLEDGSGVDLVVT